MEIRKMFGEFDDNEEKTAFLPLLYVAFNNIR